MRQKHLARTVHDLASLGAIRSFRRDRGFRVEQIRIEREIHRQPEASRQRHAQVSHKTNQVGMFVVKIPVQNPSLVGRFFQNDAQYFSLLIAK